MSPARKASKVLLPVVFLGLAVVATMIVSGQGSDAADKYASYNFRQSQTHLSLKVTSSSNIQASRWSYVGPIDNYRDCSQRNFGSFPETIKGEADVTVSASDPKTATAQVSIQPSDNGKYYCFIAAGYPMSFRIDFNPPTIKLEGSNHLVGYDQGTLYGPNGTVNSNSWQAAVFDASRKSDSYGCNAENGELNFRPTPAGIKHVGQYSHGNKNHLAYYVPGSNVEFIAEFFQSLRSALYTEEETNPALIPFDDANQYKETFTDNIHLCHRVSDPQGNTTYKLMRLDLGGPAVKVTLSGGTLQASSPAVDLDASSWRYYKLPNRYARAACERLDITPLVTGESATVQNPEDGEMYCFWALDTEGNRSYRLVKVNGGNLEIVPPIPIYRPGENNSNQQPTGDDGQGDEQNNQEDEDEGGNEPVDPPVVNQQSTNDDDDDSLTVGQQSHLNEPGGGNQQLVPGSIDFEPGNVQTAGQVQASPTTTGTEAQTAAVPEGAEPETSQVALEPAADNIASSSGELLAQEDDAAPGYFRYLIFVLAGLALAAVVMVFILFGSPPRTKKW